ncbi:peptidoglycan bridge formation glycyltransferase FemA/FemB family protein [Actinomycetaceae bacterium TAE3-ERU4]|nr:peptidoglycan bridge formation glycyltransferase FemA/FemB family protein [Actinomycetaceae bacterium TAE3-ERU4]
MNYILKKLDNSQYDAFLEETGYAEPLEQSTRWDNFDLVCEDREPYGKFIFMAEAANERKPLAICSFTKFRGRGFTYLWAKKGPVWLDGNPSAELEEAFLGALRGYLRKHLSECVFVRLHCWHKRDDLHELLQTVTYDRTVVIDLRPSEEEILASMKKRGRRSIKNAARNTGISIEEESVNNLEEFEKYYEILQYTAARDEFRANDIKNYWNMLSSLGEKTGRLFVAKLDGAPIAWTIVLTYKKQSAAYYGATSEEGRKLGVTALLDWEICRFLKAEGIESYDLMGIDSERAPQLAGVTEYKTKFSKDIVELAGAWDYPIWPMRYRLLVAALKVKRKAVSRIRKLRSA